jgi:hypothetical protein
MKKVIIDSKSAAWRTLLKTHLQDGREVDLKNFDYTVDGQFCELLTVSHGMTFKLDAKHSVGHFRKIKSSAE